MPTSLPNRLMSGEGLLGTRNRMMSLADILTGHARPKTYALSPVWRDSTTSEVKFRPLSKKQAKLIWHDARRFERATRQPGRQDGAITRNGLAVLQALFDCINYATGRLFPSHAAIAKRACISERSVRRGLVALKLAGVVSWIRRSVPEITEGRFLLRQLSNAYGIVSSSQWPGYAVYYPPCPVAPAPSEWGAQPPLPSVVAMACAAKAAGPAAMMSELETDERDPLARALASLGRSVMGRLL